MRNLVAMLTGLLTAASVLAASHAGAPMAAASGMKKDGMAADSGMKKDDMAMGKDAMGKDTMAKDAMGKDKPAKKKAKAKADGMAKQDAMGEAKK